ncbi:MAG: competence/damage-inducible protein A [Nitrospirales bacterium]
MNLRNSQAEIISIGSEFLHSHRIESNSLFIAEGLQECGVNVRWKTLVGDHEQDIVSVLKTAVRRAKVVIITGGLGSTVDDCTRESVAAMTGRPLRSRRKALHALKVQYASRGRELTKVLSRQALFPTSSELLVNPVGSAPGFSLEWKGCLVVALPGVPKEAKAMFKTQVMSLLRARISRSAVLQQRMFFTIGMTELQVDELLQPLLRRSTSAQLGLLASTQGVTVVLKEWIAVTQGKTQHPDCENGESLVQKIRDALGENIYAEDNQTMEGVVGEHLKAVSLTLALAESCTGGLIGHRLTQIPGSSSFFDRGFICYSNQSKHDILGVPVKMLRRNGAVSAPVAKAMAVGARTQSKSDIGLSVTGIAGPDGGSAKKPVGLVFIGIDGPYGTTSKQFQFYGDRQDVKTRASQAALNMLRLYVMNNAKR